jgi:hypothetical protein
MLEKKYFKFLSWYLIIAIFIIGIVSKVDAGFVTSNPVALSAIDREADLTKIQNVLETKMVADRLEKLGFTKDEINSRLQQLSDQQIHQLALKLDELKVGGDGLGVVIALLVIVILVIIILQLTGHKVIVTK